MPTSSMTPTRWWVLATLISTAMAAPAAAQTACGQELVRTSGFDGCPGYYPNADCPVWEADGQAVEMAPDSTYGGPDGNHVAEVDSEVSLAQRYSTTDTAPMRPAHNYVLQWSASRRTESGCPGPNPVDAIITFSRRTNFPSTTVMRSNTTWGLTADAPIQFTTATNFDYTVLRIRPGSRNTTTCGIIFDDIHLRNVSETTSSYTLSVAGTGSRTVTVRGLIGNGTIRDNYTISSSVTSANGQTVDACNNYSGTASTSGAISWTLDGPGHCRSGLVVGDTLTITRVQNTSTTCDYPNLTLRYVVRYPSDSRIASFEVISNGEQVALRWRSTLEADNLGYHLYREENGERIPITASPVPGSLLQLYGGRTDQGRTYSWSDAPGRAAGFRVLRYILEAIAADGSRREYVAEPREGSVTWAPRPVSLAPPRSRYSAIDLSRRISRATKLKLSAQRARGSVAMDGSVAVEPELSWRSLEQPPYFPGRCLGPLTAEENRQAQLAASTAIKIHVSRTGWYRVEAATLSQAGLSPSAAPEELALFRDGRPVAMRVLSQGSAVQAIEFFATTLDTAGTGTAVYWLARDRAAARRVVAQPSAAGSGDKLQTAVETVEEHARSTYIAAARNPDGDNFYDAILSNEITSRQLGLPAVDSAATLQARLDLRLLGLSAGEHQILVRLNGQAIGQATLVDRDEVEATLLLPHELLTSGENQLELWTAKGATDYVALRWARLSYQRRLIGAELRFTAPGGANVSISGLPSAAELYDVTDPQNVVQLTGSLASASDGYRLDAAIPAHEDDAARLLWATSPTQRLAPEKVEKNVPSSWHQRHSAGLAIIAAEDFLPAAERLAQHRRSQGWEVAVVGITDLYDEFTFGARSSEAVPCLLQRARKQWSTYPTHVLLVGDSSIDPRGFLGLGVYDFVPTKPLADDEMTAASDHWLLGGGAGATIGRLPVRTALEAAAAVDRIVAYDQTSSASDWLGRMVFVSDTDQNASDPGAVIDFAKPLESLLQLAQSTPPRQAEHLSVAYETRLAQRAELLARMNAGVSLVDYYGHGSVEVWAGNFFDVDAVSTLENADRLPLVSSATCLSGMFDDLYTRSLAEALVIRPTGGAIAVFAISTRGAPSEHAAANDKLVRTLLQQEAFTLGQAVERAKQASGDPRFWLLIGDPSLQLKGLSRPFQAGGGGAEDPRRGVLVPEEQVPPLESPDAGNRNPPEVDADENQGASSALNEQGCSCALGRVPVAHEAAGAGGVLVLLLALVLRRRQARWK